MAQNGTNTVAATTAAATAWKALQPTVGVTSVSINSPPVVKFTVKDAAGNPVVGLGNASLSTSNGLMTLTNVGFSLAKLVPGANGAPSKWVSYVVVRPATTAEKTAVPANSACDAATGATWCGTYPSYDREGTLVDYGDGTYAYTFYRNVKDAATIVASLTDSADGLSKKADLGDVSFDATATTRLGIQIGGTAPGTGSNYVDATGKVVSGGPASVSMDYPANYVYDFRPDGGAVASTRDVVTIDSCSECHAGKVLNHGSRKDPNYCATCHTDQIKFSFDREAPMNADGFTLTGGGATTLEKRANQAVIAGRAVGNLPNMIHKIHMGEFLVKQGYHYNNDDLGLFNEKKFSQDVRNCSTCHDGSATATHKTTDGDNWKNVPSRLACGACHDGIDFATGSGVTLSDHAAGKTSTTIYSGKAHGGGAQTDDSICVLCHKPDAIATYHIPVTPPDSGNALNTAGGNTHSYSESIDANTSNLPAGAIVPTWKIISVSKNASGNPVMVFQLMQNGVAVPLNDPTAKTEIWDNFIGAPSLYWVWAVPQDGITAPSDFNASANAWLKALWNHTLTGSSAASTLTYDSATGYYTATKTGTTIPSTAVMLTGGIGYSYGSGSQPLTQTNVAGYPISTSPVDATKFVGGLAVPAPNVSLIATGYTARRQVVDTAKCNKCHKALGVFTDAAFHAGQRNDGATCAFCHNPGRASSGGWSLDAGVFIHAIHASGKRSVVFNYNSDGTNPMGFGNIGYPGVLQKCEQCHLPGTYDFSAAASQAQVANRLYRTTYSGAGLASASEATSFGWAPSALVPRDTSDSADNLVSSPIAASCYSCHDGKMVSNPSQDVRDHIEQLGGGSIYRARSVAIAKQEACLLCHQVGGFAPIAAMHTK